MASKNTSVSLSDHFIDFADRQVASGRHGSTSDVVCARLRPARQAAELQTVLSEFEPEPPEPAYLTVIAIPATINTTDGAHAATR